ncbi:hypothetical protein ACHQM5_017030 [Ranunculus cassubicifolius]
MKSSSKQQKKGNLSIFKSPSQSQLQKSISLRNEDGRSLLHVASIIKNLGFNQNRIFVNRSSSKLQKLSVSYLRIGRDNTRNNKGLQISSWEGVFSVLESSEL